MAPTELEITAGSGLWGLGVGESDHLAQLFLRVSGVIHEGSVSSSWAACSVLEIPKLMSHKGLHLLGPAGPQVPSLGHVSLFFRFFYSVSPKHLCFFFYTDSVVLLSLNVLCTRLYISSTHKDYAPSIGSIATELCCPLDTRGAIPV